MLISFGSAALASAAEIRDGYLHLPQSPTI
jgi:hypothetical protein